MLRDATQEDYEYIASHSISRGLCGKGPDQIDYIYTLEIDDVIMGIGGFRILNLATAYVWIDLSHDAAHHTLTLVKTLKATMASFVEEHKLRRLESHVSVDFPEAIRLLQHMGFTRECVIKNYMPDSDAFLYKRCF